MVLLAGHIRDWNHGWNGDGVERKRERDDIYIMPANVNVLNEEKGWV